MNTIRTLVVAVALILTSGTVQGAARFFGRVASASTKAASVFRRPAGATSIPKEFLHRLPNCFWCMPVSVCVATGAIYTGQKLSRPHIERLQGENAALVARVAALEATRQQAAQAS